MKRKAQKTKRVPWWAPGGAWDVEFRARRAIVRAMDDAEQRSRKTGNCIVDGDLPDAWLNGPSVDV